MAIYGVNSSNSSNQLASLLRGASVNKQMLQKAYSSLYKSNSELAGSMTNSKIPSGTVDQLVKNYYKNLQSEMEKAETDNESSTSSEDNIKALNENTASMRTSALGLLNTGAMGNDELVKTVNSFVEDYNKTVKTLKDSDNFVAVSSGINMVNTTASYAGALKGAGITVNDDNTLSVNESVLKANANKAKALFEGNYSYGGKMAKKASDLQTLARLGNNGTGIYNRYGSFFGNSLYM